jgi:hypothetical protein
MEWDWGHTVVTDLLYDGWKKNYSHIHRRKTGGVVAKCFLQRGTLLPHSYDDWLFSNIKRDSEMAVINWAMHYSQQQKIP